MKHLQLSSLCFLGEQLEDVVMQLIDKGDATSSIQKGKLKTGASTLPDLNKDGYR